MFPSLEIRLAMHSHDLIANLYFAAAVRVAADHSMTRLLPLENLKEPLSPHEDLSHRILLSLQALGAIEPELSQAIAQDLLTIEDWIAVSFGSLAWRICWSPRDCRERRNFAEELLRDELPTDRTLEGLLGIWEAIAIAEVAQYANWLLEKSGYNPQWDRVAIGNVRAAIKTFSASKVMYLVHLALRATTTTHQQGGIAASKLGNVFADAIGSFTRRAIVENWTIRSIERPIDLPISAIAAIFSHEVTRLDDEYLTLTPSFAALLNAMSRGRSLH